MRLIATATCAEFAAAASRAFFARAREIHGQRAAAQVPAIQALDGALGFGIAAHGYERKTAWAVCCAIHHQARFGNGAKSREGVLQVIFSGFEGNVSNV